MANRREQILNRLHEIALARKEPPFSEYVTVERNKGHRENHQRPACVLTDGGQSAELNGDRTSRRGGTVLGPSLQRMRPSLYILPKEQRPTNDKPENIGTVGNGLMLSLCKAIAMDATLKALIGANGSLQMESTETDLESGAAMSGEVKIALSIVYPFNPATD